MSDSDMLARWAEVVDQYSAVESFLDWLWDEHGLDLDYDHAKPGTPLERRKLIDAYFDIDRKRLDSQRRQLLKQAPQAAKATLATTPGPASAASEAAPTAATERT